MKKLIPALCMLLVSAMLLGTSTYAWFTMNKTVTATGLQVKARAEGGIVIFRTGGSRATATTTVSSSLGAAAALLPTSTADAAAWYHAEGTTDTNGAALNGVYSTLTLANEAPGNTNLGLRYVVNPGDGTDKSQAYVLYDIYTVVPDTNSSKYTDLWVSECTVTGATKDLSKSLRVLVKCGANVSIFAPVDGATLAYSVNGTAISPAAVDSHTSGATPLTKTISGTGKNILVSGEVETATVEVYVYFEGEDTNHTTSNLATGIENLTIQTRFTCTSVSAGATS